MKPAAIAAAVLFAAVSGAHAQELIAWPMGAQNVFRVLLPGMPIRPILPPRPLPPRPVPLPPGPRPLPAPPPPVVRPPDSTPLHMSGYRVEGSITDKVAELTYNITFHNPTSRRLEGVLIMPIPADTVFSGFTMTVGGKSMKGELLQADQASTIYQNIVRQMRDPGLLELVGERMIRAQVFPIEPNSDIIVRMSVSQILRKSGGLLALNVPLRSAKMSGSETAAGSSVRLTLTSEKPIRTLYSPMPDVKVVRDGDKRAAISYDTTAAVDRDLSLFYSVQEDPLAASVLTFKEEGEDGFFMLSLNPKRESTDKDVVPKDIIFIVDRSGSMEDDGKMTQAKAALKYCVQKLRPADRFGIVDFATDSNLFENRLVEATADNKARAQRYIQRIDAAGGTNIEAALNEGLRLLTKAPGRMPMVFFLTDGLPTVGQTHMDTLLAQAASKNEGLRSRLFTFGVGGDVNTLFLDKLAEMNRGDRDYVRPGETIEGKVSTLYQKVDRPAMTDVRIDWEGVDAQQVYPRPITDLFYGSELVLMGRYKGHGKGKLVITGNAAGKEARFVYPVDLPETAGKNAFLPRLWANLKVTHELDALRLAGGVGRANPEVVESIVRLAKRYGIVTPYTSYLITEEGFDMPRASREAQNLIQVLRADASASGVTGGPGTAMRAQEASAFFSRASRMEGAAGGGGRWTAARKSAPAAVRGLMDEAEKDARTELKESGRTALKTRSMGGKTFYLRGGAWVDGEYDEARHAAAKSVRVRYMSDEYFKLIEDLPGLARYLAIGPKVTVVLGGAAYHVTD